MSKVRVDSNNRVFLIVNGGVYRPDIGPHEYPIPQRSWGRGITSAYAEGSTVKARHLAQTPFCKLTSPDGTEEVWTLHGHDVSQPESCFYQPTVAPTASPLG